MGGTSRGDRPVRFDRVEMFARGQAVELVFSRRGEPVMRGTFRGWSLSLGGWVRRDTVAILLDDGTYLPDAPRFLVEVCLVPMSGRGAEIS